MFKYVGNISDLSHHIIKNFTGNFGTAVDATLGNGYDTDFLIELFERVYAFDIQKQAVDNYSARGTGDGKVTLINDSHQYLDRYISDRVDCIVYNLGFLPGGDKAITTEAESTLESLCCGLELLNPGGLITIAVYWGHETGREEGEKLLAFLEKLPKSKYGVMHHTYINRENRPPSLFVIEKKQDS